MSQAMTLLPPNFVQMPRNRSIVGKIGGKIITVAKKTRRRFKLSKQHRDKIAAGLRRFKLPVLTVGANLPWVLPAVSALKTQGMNALNGSQFAQMSIINSLVSPFVPVKFEWSGSAMVPKLSFGGLLTGLIPNMLVAFMKKFNIFRGVNQRLARNRLPVTLA